MWGLYCGSVGIMEKKMETAHPRASIPGGFPKLGEPLLGVPIIRVQNIWVSILGSPCCGKLQPWATAHVASKHEKQALGHLKTRNLHLPRQIFP